MHLLVTLGIPSLAGGSPLSLSSPRRQLSLLAYLARRPRAPSSRTALAALLWESRDEAKARQSLRQALLELKRLLGDGLTLTDDHVSLADGALDVDAALFERDIAAGRFADAIERWHGDFLTGFDDIGDDLFRAWIDSERELLRRALDGAYARLVDERRIAGAPSDAIAWATRWANAFPHDERAHHRLIDLLRAANRADDALAHQRAYTARLRAELDAQPSPSFAGLAAELARESASGAPTRGPAPRSPGSVAIFTPDLIARGAALAELHAAWTEARAGQVTGVLIEGDVGIGKTRLSEELVRGVEARGSAIVLRAHGDAREEEPLQAIRELAHALGDAPGLLGISPGALAQLGLLSPAIAARVRGAPPTAPGDEVAFADALAQALGSVAEDDPVLVYCDDFPQMDPASQRVLVRATARARGAICYLFVARTADESATPIAELRARPGIRRLLLQPLTEREVDALIATMLAMPDADRATLAARLHDAAAGNPLQTVELTTALIDDGALELGADGVWHLSAAARADLPLPATLQDAIARRLTRLGTRVRAFAECAAVLGHSFDPRAAARLAGIPAGEWEALLDELVARKLARPRAAASAPSAPIFEFAHEAVWTALHDAIDPARLSALEKRAMAASDPRRTRRRWLAGGLSAAALAALSAVAVSAMRARHESALDVRRVIVAQLENRSGDASLDGIGLLAADWITDGIASARIVRVIDPRSAAASIRTVAAAHASDRSLDVVGALGRESGAGRVIWGTYLRSGDRLTYQMRVSDVETGEVLRAMAPITGSATDPTAAMVSLREQVLGALAIIYDVRRSDMVANATRPPRYDAYQIFQEGMTLQLAFKGPAAIERYRRAWALDSGFFQPLIWAADATELSDAPAQKDSILRIAERHREEMGTFDRLFLDTEEAELTGDLARAIVAARTLVDLTGASENYMLLSQEEFNANRPRESLESMEHVDPERGILKGWPGYYVSKASAMHLLGESPRALDVAAETRKRFPATVYGMALEARERGALGDTARTRAILLEASGLTPDPYRPPVWVAAIAITELRAHGHRDAAVRLALRSLDWARRDTTGGVGYSRYLLAMLYAGERWDDARQIVDRLMRADSTNVTWIGYDGALAARRGDRGGAERAMARLVALQGPYTAGDPQMWRARIAGALGDRVRAMALLRESFAHGLVMDGPTHTIPDFELLHDDPAYRELMRPKG